MRRSLIILSFSVFTWACSGEATSDQTTDQVESVETNPSEEAIEAPEEPETTEMDAAEAVEETTSLTFCECVRMLKDLEDKMLGSDTDEELETLDAEMARIRVEQCQILDQGDQSTPEARAERQAKIDACLK